jgi:uncharacterized membrane protein YGL010W
LQGGLNVVSSLYPSITEELRRLGATRIAMGRNAVWYLPDAPLLTIPALILWMAWDITIGLAIAVTSIPLLFAAGAIAIHVNIPWVWLTAVGLFVLGWALQIIGHQLFEGNRPTLLDNPVQMLISPMYIFAKLFVALGLRQDLAAILQKSFQPTPLERLHRPVGGQADVGKTS